MGSSLSVLTVVTPILALLAGIIAIIVEQIDEKLDRLRNRIGRNPVSPKVYGWTIADLEKIKKNWIILDPKGAEFPVNEPYAMTMPEQVREIIKFIFTILKIIHFNFMILNSVDFKNHLRWWTASLLEQRKRAEKQAIMALSQKSNVWRNKLEC